MWCIVLLYASLKNLLFVLDLARLVIEMNLFGDNLHFHSVHAMGA